MTAVRTATLHHPRQHAAVRTRDYVFSQLIPYIGNKRKLLHLIDEAVTHTGIRAGIFVDLFAGSTVVSRWAKKAGFRVIANDWEPYACEIARGTVALNAPPPRAAQRFAELRALKPVDGYIARHLCPQDDECPDPTRERMFFTRANGSRIDAIRERIDLWQRRGTLTPEHRAYFLAALIYAASYASNTSGVFKGFHHGWGGKTATALYRIRGDLAFAPPVLHDNGQPNLVFQEDAQILAASLTERAGERPDIVYLDPPYNQHPYGSNYHVLNTIALWDKPPLNPSILVDGRTTDKSAIRKDWRTQRRSAYNHHRQALGAFTGLLDVIDARWILTSYSTDGNIDLTSLITALAQRGSLTVFTAPYKRYRVSTPRMSQRSHNVEFVAVLDTQGPAATRRVATIVRHITRQLPNADLS